LLQRSRSSEERFRGRVPPEGRSGEEVELLHLLPKALPKGKISAQETLLSLSPALKIRVTVAFTLKSIKKH